MSVRLWTSTILIGFCALPRVAAADSLFQGLGNQDSYRPSYREAYNDYPPVQHGLFGQPEAPPSVYGRPGYRETYNDYPPPGGRYGGGLVEYFMTGGRPEPVPAQVAAPQPVYAAPQPVYNGGERYNPALSGLPQAGLPDYAPQPAAGGYGNLQATYNPSAYQQSGGVVTSAPGYDPVAANPGIVSRQLDPIYYRQDVAFDGRERAGTIVIDTPHKFLYLVQKGGHALRYGIGVGRPGFAWSGVKTISRKAEWPGWTPPREMLARRPDLPRHMDGGEANPLGARALYLGSSMYRIHGTNEPYTIGTNVSSGCIRMMNQDVIDLYGRVGVGTRVVVM